MSNVIIMPIKINHETEKAVLIGDIIDNIWLPKSQIVVKRGCVLAVAGWLYKKYKNYFTYANCKSIEELEKWMDYEEEVAKLMAEDPTLCRCKRCGRLFHSETQRNMCINCDIDYTIALGQTAKFGTMSSKEQSDAIIRGVIHKP